MLLSDGGGAMPFAAIRDVPRAGERISAGKPVCTVFAAGRDAAECYTGLIRRAAWVYSQLAAWERNVA
jgi:predicted ATP-grasp superfamily ATP-dependent carboligase